MLSDLEKLPEHELKKILDKNKNFPIGGIAVPINSKELDNILNICFRDKGRIFYKKERYNNGVETVVNSCYLADVIPLTFARYKDLKNSKYIYGGTILKTVDKFKYYLEKVVASVHNKDEFEVIENYDSNSITLVLYYPEINITNSLGMKHTLKEVFLKMRFNKDSTSYWKLYDIYLNRTCLSNVEYYNSYVFSHAKTDYGSFGSSTLCFGATALERMVSRYKNAIPIAAIPSFILSFRKYLEWESIEGTPYRHLSSLKPYTVINNSYHSLELTRYLYGKLFTLLDKFEYTISGDNLIGFNVSLTSASKELISNIVNAYVKSHIKTLSNKFKDRGIIGRNINDSFGEIAPIKIVNLNISKKPVIFKEKEFNYRIEDVKIDIEEITKSFPEEVNSNIIQEIIGMLKQDFTNYFINSKLQDI